MLTLISNSAHYKEVLSRVQSVKHMLWIGAADIKDLYIEIGKEKKPFLALIAQLIRRDAEVRDSVLASTNNVKIREEHIIPDTMLLYGSDINFTFENYNF